MTDTTLAQDAPRFTLLRVHPDGTTEHVSKHVSNHPDLAEGWQAGTTVAHAEPAMAFSLYRPDGSRAARFAHNRLRAGAVVLDLDTLVL